MAELRRRGSTGARAAARSPQNESDPGTADNRRGDVVPRLARRPKALDRDIRRAGQGYLYNHPWVASPA